MTKEDEIFKIINELHVRSRKGEILAEQIRDAANELGAVGVHIKVNLFPSPEVGKVLGCVIDPDTGQCVNYFSIPDPTGNLLSTIVRHGVK